MLGYFDLLHAYQSFFVTNVFSVLCYRGFLKGDKALGQAAVKLAPFDNKSEIHECVDVSESPRCMKELVKD